MPLLRVMNLAYYIAPLLPSCNMVRCLIYSLDSSTEASCALAPQGVVGLLRLPTALTPQTIDALRCAHLFAPVSVDLTPPISVTNGMIECSGLHLKL